ncbi:DUF2064 domain-containing protein [uncultured Algoriphagus sp.]|uniref:TIGR04282 family arsenosugar biosynthesis glycosyltransferase n=1 Tax=uncultured Algoriphagus sp. TaxID=417365 RepID=UPI0030EB73E1|tara:strand:- start:18526 stop:19227 length:702 start_codon:yes stop_codon:yes gene_type:complete
MQHSSKTALMVYAICPKIQAGKKAVFGKAHFRKSLELFARLQENTEEIAAQSGLPTFWIFDHEQEGKTFGERYAKAFDSLFKEGFDQVISIGNDIPGLDSSHILRAKEEFLNSETILGPAEDGGNYLIALSRKGFDKNSFADLPWNSDSLHHALKSWSCAKNDHVSQLEYLIDIDDFDSLARFKEYSESTDFTQFILQLIRSILAYSQAKKTFFKEVFISKDNPLRAPPAFLS